MSSERDPRAELATLARALRNWAVRRSAVGHRIVVPRTELEAAPTPPLRTRAESAAPPPAAPAGPETPAVRAPACGDLEALRAAVAECTACGLCRTRTQTVFSDGTGRARVVFVGEAPGFHEDQRGVPFVGRAGELLTDIVTKGMGLSREDVYIANVLKCRPPENRDPTAAEKALCTPWLDRQLELVGADVIVALGRHAAGHLLGTTEPMGRLRGRVHTRGGVKVVATYHPAYLLRSPHMKKECWKDIQLAMAELGLSPPGRAGGPR